MSFYTHIIFLRNIVTLRKAAILMNYVDSASKDTRERQSKGKSYT